MRIPRVYLKQDKEGFYAEHENGEILGRSKSIQVLYLEMMKRSNKENFYVVRGEL